MTHPDTWKGETCGTCLFCLNGDFADCVDGPLIGELPDFLRRNEHQTKTEKE